MAHTDAQLRYKIMKEGEEMGHLLDILYPDHKSDSCDPIPDARVQGSCSCGWKGQFRPYNDWRGCHDDYAAHLEQVRAAENQPERIAA